MCLYFVQTSGSQSYCVHIFSKSNGREDVRTHPQPFIGFPPDRYIPLIARIIAARISVNEIANSFAFSRKFT